MRTRGICNVLSVLLLTAMLSLGGLVPVFAEEPAQDVEVPVSTEMPSVDSDEDDAGVVADKPLDSMDNEPVAELQGVSNEAMNTEQAPKVQDSADADVSWHVVISPMRNTTAATVSVEDLEAIIAGGSADAITIDAAMSYNGIVTRSVSKTVALADIDTATSSFEMDFADFGRFTVNVRFTLGGSTVAGSVETQTVAVVADEYNIAPLTATMPVTMFSLSLWGEGNIRTSGPTIAMLMRAGAWDWSALPGPRDGMYGVYALPYLTDAEIAYQASDYGEERAVYYAHLKAFSAYVTDLHALDPSSRFNLFTGDNFPDVIQSIIFANGIPEGSYTFALLSDGARSYSSFKGTYNAADNSSVHAGLVQEWKSAKARTYESGSPAGGIYEKHMYACIDAEPDASWWLIRPALLETVNDGGAFGAAARSNSKIKTMNLATGLANVQAAGEEAVAEFKALFNFNDGFFSAAQESGKDVMMFLGTRVTSESSFEEYARFVMTYYGDAYEYYYKGHPATPTDLYPAKASQLLSLGTTDIDSTIAAELILFFNPEIYLSGYASSTYASVPVGMAKGMFNMTKASGIAQDNYRNMEFWMTAVGDSTPAAAKALCTEGHDNYLVEFSDSVISEKGYDIAIWDANDSVIIYYKQLDDGTYAEIGSDQGDQGGVKLPEGTYIIQSAMKDGQVLDVANELQNPGANVALWAYGGRANQQWNLSYGEDGLAVLTNVKSGLPLDVSNKSSKPGTNVCQWTANDGANQKWRIQANSDGTYTFISQVDNHAVLDVANNTWKNGANLEIWSPNGGKNQRFRLIPVPPHVSSEGMANLADGLYALTPAVNTAERLDIANESKAASGNAIVWTSTSMDNQVFNISKAEDGFYIIANANSGLVLDIPSGSLIAGANVCQSTRADKLTQEWAIFQRSGGSYVFQNVGTGLMLEVAGGSKTAGANVQGGSENGGQAQRWSIVRTTTVRAALDALARQNKNSILEGDYVIQTIMKDGQVVAVKANALAANANVELNAYGARSSQRWHFEYDETGYVTITNKGSGLVLEVADASHANGANVRQAMPSDSYGQKWIVRPNGDGSYTIISGVSPQIVLDVTNEKTGNGTNIETWTANGGRAQKFYLLPLEPTISKVGMANDLDGRTFTIAPVIGPGRRLDVANKSTADGANITCWTANGGANQQWRFVRLDDGFYRIESALSGKLLDVSGGNVIPGANVIQWEQNGGRNQEWAVYRQTDGSYTLRNVGTGLMLDVYGSSAANGANVDAYRENGARSQRWTLAEMGE